MKHLILSAVLTFVCFSAIAAQKNRDTAPMPGQNETTTKKMKVDGNTSANSSGSLDLQSGTQVAAQLQSTLDVKKAVAGDEILLKTSRAVKQNGRVVLEKGSTLIGRVTDVQQKTKGAAVSKVGVLFDRVRTSGGMITPISATIMSVTNVSSSAVYNDSNADVFGSASTQTTTSAQGSTRSNGGLLGGVGNTVGGVGNVVGGVVNTATHTTGSVVGTAGQTVVGVAGSVKGLSISQSSSSNAQGGSTLSMSGNNLKLEKGMTFNLSLSQSSSVSSQ